MHVIPFCYPGIEMCYSKSKSLFIIHCRDLPLCLGISMTIVTGCYVLINIAYIAVLGKDGILGSAAVALVNKNIYLFKISPVCLRMSVI